MLSLSGAAQLFLLRQLKTVEAHLVRAGAAQLFQLCSSTVSVETVEAILVLSGAAQLFQLRSVENS